MTVLRVLVPRDSVELLTAPGEIEAVGYLQQTLPSLLRLRRRIAPLAPATLLRAKLTLPPTPDLARVEALWLSEQVSLQQAEWRILLERLPRLRWVYSQRTSYHHLDLGLFRERNIAISNSGALVSRWVAEFAFAALLAERKKLPTHVRATSPGMEPVSCRPLTGTRVAVLGTGRIGAEFAAMGTALGMEVIGLSRDPSRFGPSGHPYSRLAHLERDLAEVLGSAEALVVTVPGGPATQGLVGARQLALLPPGAAIISVTHADVIDQAALFAALRRGRLAGAYLDRVRPFRRFPGRNVPNLVLLHNSTAHLAEKASAAAAAFQRGLEALRRGEDPADRIA